MCAKKPVLLLRKTQTLKHGLGESVLSDWNKYILGCKQIVSSN